MPKNTTHIPANELRPGDRFRLPSGADTYIVLGRLGRAPSGRVIYSVVRCETGTTTITLHDMETVYLLPKERDA